MNHYQLDELAWAVIEALQQSGIEFSFDMKEINKDEYQREKYAARNWWQDFQGLESLRHCKALAGELPEPELHISDRMMKAAMRKISSERPYLAEVFVLVVENRGESDKSIDALVGKCCKRKSAKARYRRHLDELIALFSNSDIAKKIPSAKAHISNAKFIKEKNAMITPYAAELIKAHELRENGKPTPYALRLIERSEEYARIKSMQARVKTYRQIRRAAKNGIDKVFAEINTSRLSAVRLNARGENDYVAY